MRLLITGASSGIGAALARFYAPRASKLYLIARRKERLEELQHSLHDYPCEIEIIPLDISHFDKVRSIATRIAIADVHLDMIICNAGMSIGHDASVCAFEDFKQVYDVNLLSVHALLEPFDTMLKTKKKTHIVFISSLASLVCMPTSIAYSSAKRAMNAYAEGVRFQYRQHNVTVTTVLPGFIQTELTAKNNFSMPFLLSLEEGTKRVIDAIETKKRVYYFPKRFFLLIWLFKVMPQRIKDAAVGKIYKAL